ncbi:hypothetical protein ABPG75_003488 [Micractinium tetrahymenae]
MEALQAALAATPGSLALLEEAARLQACGRCCLRLAGVHDASAYADSSIPVSAATVLRALEILPIPGGSTTATEGLGEAEAQGGSKRRRLDDSGAAATAGAGARAGAPQVLTDAAEAAERDATVVCPLCLGLLQPAAPASSAAGSSCQQLLGCSLELVTTTSTLNDSQRYATLAFGPTVAATAAAAAAGDEQGQENGRGGGGSSAPLAPVVAQRSAAVPTLAAAAAAMAAEFDFDCFALEVSLPASLGVRQQALSWRLRQGEGAQDRAAALAAILDMREAVWLHYSAALAAALGKPVDANAALRITLTASHPDAAAECGWLAPATGASGGRHRRGGRGGRQQQRQQAAPQDDTPAVLTDAVVSRLHAMSQAEFDAACPPSTAQLLPSAAAAGVQLQARRRPVHVGGRYLKLRRGIPQSPWVIDGQRKGEGSVQEAIERAVLPAFQADSFTLVSAGREDMDVRMLGEGRPFILQIENARRGMPPSQRLQEMGAGVPQASAGGVAVRGLFAASPAQLAWLKEGEQEKEKSYVAVCWLPRPLTDADVATIEGTRGLEVQQQTPIRVLHRRANLERPKVVQEMSVHRLAGPPGGRGSYFALRLRTQAGTYIKEFVHGDLGRTRPSLGDLLGGCRAQIVSLDVEQVHMEFGAERRQP